MGLFGLFATMFGLGAMMKDAISDQIATDKSYNKAVETGSATYFGNGAKLYSTETGRRCRKEYVNRRTLIYDLKTNRLIEDSTLKANLEKERQGKAKVTQDCVFYKKFEWDVPGHSCNIWVSDVVPGYFERIVGRNGNQDMFVKGKLEDVITGYWKGCKHVNFIGPIKTMEWYYPDGALRTKEEINRRDNIKWKQQAIEAGDRFYGCIDNVYGIVARDVKTDELYVHNQKDDYYIKANPAMVKEEIRKPHHEEVEIVTKYVLEEDPHGMRWNKDGTKWVP